MPRRPMLVAFVVVLLLAGSGLGLRLYMGRAGEDRLLPGEHVSVRALRDPLPGNAFLACPAGWCRATAAPSPIFALPAERLADTARRMIAAEPGVAIVESAPARLVVIQHTPLLRFPDVVTVEFVALGPDRSSLAIYSRARYGRSDFGANRKRVLSWLSRLEGIAGQ